MSKKSSPLKHKEGEAVAHAPYGTEEDYHKARGGEVGKIKKPTRPYSFSPYLDTITTI